MCLSHHSKCFYFLLQIKCSEEESTDSALKCYKVKVTCSCTLLLSTTVLDLLVLLFIGHSFIHSFIQVQSKLKMWIALLFPWYSKSAQEANRSFVTLTKPLLECPLSFFCFFFTRVPQTRCFKIPHRKASLCLKSVWKIWNLLFKAKITHRICIVPFSVFPRGF